MAEKAASQGNPAEMFEGGGEQSVSNVAEVTDNTNSSDKGAAKDDKLAPSQISSESTSGIGSVSPSTISTSEIPRENAADSKEKIEPSVSLSEPTSNVDEMENSESASEMEGVKTLDAEKEKTEVSLTHSQNAAEESETKKTSETTCKEAKEENVAGETKDIEAVSTGTSPPRKKSIFKRFTGLISPKKLKPKDSRSKSMSPSEKNKPATSDNFACEEANVSSAVGEPVKNENEKPGFLTTIKRRLSKISIRPKFSSSESQNLVSDEETETVEEPTDASKPEALPVADVDQSNYKESYWADGDTTSSLTDKPSWDGTTMTDIPSAWSGGTDVFPTDSSRIHSETGENTSEEAIAGSWSSPDEQIPDIKEDKDSETDKTVDVAPEENREDQSCSEEKK